MNCEAIYNEAHKAGMASASVHTPTPMIVNQHANMMNDNSPVVKQWKVSGGVCGFAEVIIKPATSTFVRYLRSKGIGRKSYYGGWSIWVSYFGQSMELKEKYAEAFSKVLNDNEINSYATSRMD